MGWVKAKIIQDLGLFTNAFMCCRMILAPKNCGVGKERGVELTNIFNSFAFLLLSLIRRGLGGGGGAYTHQRFNRYPTR